jgi:hypothetical protein
LSGVLPAAPSPQGRLPHAPLMAGWQDASDRAISNPHEDPSPSDRLNFARSAAGIRHWPGHVRRFGTHADRDRIFARELNDVLSRSPARQPIASLWPKKRGELM